MSSKAEIEIEIARMRSSADESRRVVCGSRKGKYFLAPAEQPTDVYSAGYEENVFETEAEAEAAIPGLCECGPSFEIEWIVGQYS